MGSDRGLGGEAQSGLANVQASHVQLHSARCETWLDGRTTSSPQSVPPRSLSLQLPCRLPLSAPASPLVDGGGPQSEERDVVKK